MTQETHDAVEEADYDETEERGPIPNTVLLPALLFIACGVIMFAVAVAIAALGVTGGWSWPLALLGGAALAATGLGLYQRSRIAHTAAYLAGGLLILTGFGIIPGVALIWSLSMRSAKYWFNIR